MKICPNCKNEIVDNATFCPICGTAQNAAPAYDPNYRPDWQAQNAAPGYGAPGYGAPGYAAPQPVVSPYDHTKEFSDEDIHENKLVALLIYTMGLIGIVIASLVAKDSAYVKFHTRQGMKFVIAEFLLGIVIGLLCWTIIIPICGGIAFIILFVLKCISFVQVCGNKACEPAILRSIGFLK